MPRRSVMGACRGTVDIRRVTPDERTMLRLMAQRYWKDLMPHSRIVQDAAVRRIYFQRRFRLDDPDVYIWWARVKGEHVGFAHVAVREDETGESYADVHDFYIESTHRRQGYGRALWEQVRERLARSGVQGVDLHVRRDNPGAMDFWSSVGFELASYRLRQYLAD